MKSRRSLLRRALGAVGVVVLAAVSALAAIIVVAVLVDVAVRIF